MVEVGSSDMLAGSSDILIGPRVWGSSKPVSLFPHEEFSFTRFRFSYHYPTSLIGWKLPEEYSTVSLPLRTIEQVRDALNSSSPDYGGDIDSLFATVVGPWHPAEVWTEIFESGAEVFKRKTDHRIMMFRSIVSDIPEPILEAFLRELLEGEMLRLDQLFRNEIGRVLAESDLVVLESDLESFHIASPYAHDKLRGILESLQAKQGFTTKLKRFFSI